MWTGKNIIPEGGLFHLFPPQWWADDVGMCDGTSCLSLSRLHDDPPLGQWARSTQGVSGALQPGRWGWRYVLNNEAVG